MGPAGGPQEGLVAAAAAAAAIAQQRKLEF